jgi:hypothetical protein
MKGAATTITTGMVTTGALKTVAMIVASMYTPIKIL